MRVRITVELDDGTVVLEEIVGPEGSYTWTAAQARPIVDSDGSTLAGFRFLGWPAPPELPPSLTPGERAVALFDSNDCLDDDIEMIIVPADPATKPPADEPLPF